MKKYLVVLIVLVLLVVPGCKKSNNDIKEKESYKLEVGKSTNLVDVKDREEIIKILKENDIANVDLLSSWLDDFNKEEDMECGLKNWSDTSSFAYNDGKCADRYEKNHELSDGNCRLTAFTLMHNRLSFSNKKSDYGPYLMFDIDVLENNDSYSFVKERMEEFISLYDEINVDFIADENLDQVFIDTLNERGISFRDDKVKLISLVIHDDYDKVLFVGHTGILVELDGKYLFIEKIAFEQPYQVSVLNSKDDLINMFKNRPSYFSNEDEIGPFLYENNKLIYTFNN